MVAISGNHTVSGSLEVTWFREPTWLFRPREKPSKHQYRDFMKEQHRKKSWKNKY
jgi:hypothetical protein